MHTLELLVHSVILYILSLSDVENPITIISVVFELVFVEQSNYLLNKKILTTFD